jgi:hypothetical protein
MIDVTFYDGTHARLMEWARLDFCQRYTCYRNKQGAVDMNHISKAIEVCGFVEVTSSNFEHVKAALEQRAAAKAQLQTHEVLE